MSMLDRHTLLSRRKIAVAFVTRVLTSVSTFPSLVAELTRKVNVPRTPYVPMPDDNWLRWPALSSPSDLHE